MMLCFVTNHPGLVLIAILFLKHGNKEFKVKIIPRILLQSAVRNNFSDIVPKIHDFN